MDKWISCYKGGLDKRTYIDLDIFILVREKRSVMGNVSKRRGAPEDKRPRKKRER